MKTIKQFFEQNFINLSIVILGFLLLFSAALYVYNEAVMEDAEAVKIHSERVKLETENIFTTIRQIDISLRGFAIIAEEQFLFYPVEKAKKDNERIIKRLDSLLNIQNYKDPENFAAVKRGLNDYITRYETMLVHIKNNDREEVEKFMRKFYGKEYHVIHKRFADKLSAYEEGLINESNIKHQNASLSNAYVQGLLILAGIPTLLLLFFRLRKQETVRQNLLIDLAENNRKFLFNSGNELKRDAQDILENSIKNLRKASDFVTEISESNFEVKWEDLNDQNRPLNTDNLVGKLIQMREQMKKVKQEDESRLWVTEGLAQISDIIRNHQDNFKELGEKTLKHLVKYLNSQQGSMFLINEENTDKPYLDMISCFAFDKKKHIEKRIEIGQGIVGQTFLEGTTTMITELPDGYIKITSGLGDSTPSCLLIVPMKFNEKVVAVVELASFEKYMPHEINFVEKAGEFIASAISTASNASKTEKLLQEFRIQTETLKAQEEELRQNMEELEATQEQMQRKERLLEKKME